MIDIHDFFVICGGVGAAASMILLYSVLKNEPYGDRRWPMFAMILATVLQASAGGELLKQGVALLTILAWIYLPTFVIAPFIGWLWWRIRGKPKATPEPQ